MILFKPFFWFFKAVVSLFSREGKKSEERQKLERKESRELIRMNG
jgi:hypothetical protein